MNSREAFEKLPEIAESLKDQEVYYDVKEQCYIATDVEFYYDAGYANGANYAFQEQQKVVDEQQKRISFLEMNIKYVLDHFYMNDLDKAMPRVYEDLKEALRGGQ